MQAGNHFTGIYCLKYFSLNSRNVYKEVKKMKIRPSIASFCMQMLSILSRKMDEKDLIQQVYFQQ